MNDNELKMEEESINLVLDTKELSLHEVMEAVAAGRHDFKSGLKKDPTMYGASPLSTWATFYSAGYADESQLELGIAKIK